MTTTTDKGLTDEELMAIVEAATPGPWYQSGQPWFQTGGFVLAGSPDPHAGTVLADLSDTWEMQRADDGLDADHERDPDDDAKFIATFDPPMVRALIERARAAEVGALAMEEALKAARDALGGEYAGHSSPSRHVSAAHKIIDRALSTEAQS